MSLFRCLCNLPGSHTAQNFFADRMHWDSDILSRSLASFQPVQKHVGSLLALQVRAFDKTDTRMAADQRMCLASGRPFRSSSLPGKSFNPISLCEKEAPPQADPQE